MYNAEYMSEILEQNFIFFAIAVLIVIVLLVSWIAYLHFRFNRLMRNAHKDNLEKSLLDIYTFLDKNHKNTSQIITSLKTLNAKIHQSPRGLGLVLFKAFDGVKSGGSNSFAFALINEAGDGAIISTLHSRDRVNVYSKEIKAFKAHVQLTEEEEEALTKAQNSLSL